MKWRTRRPPSKSWTRKAFVFYDLISDEDELLGWVKSDTVTRVFTPDTNYYDSEYIPALFDNLKDAKAYLVAHFVLQKLEDT